jgi:hypothetical protein
LFAVPATCTILGMLFFHIAAFGCKTFKSEAFGFDYKLGYFSADSGGGCVQYVNTGGLPGAFKFGRFIGVVGALLIWVVVAAVMAASCFKYPNSKKYFMIISICMGVLSLFSFLLLVGLSAADSYSLGGGGALAILSAFLWAGGAVSMFHCMNERERAPSTPNKTTATESPEEPAINVTENADELTDHVVIEL